MVISRSLTLLCNEQQNLTTARPVTTSFQNVDKRKTTLLHFLVTITTECYDLFRSEMLLADWHLPANLGCWCYNNYVQT